MRVLIVAMADSVHTARWISQISDQSWDLHLFPSLDVGIVHKELRNVTVYHSFYARQPERHSSVKLKGIPLIHKEAAQVGIGILRRCYKSYLVDRLVRVIRSIRPDVIHSMEIQGAGYLTVEAKKRLSDPFPRCVITSWGSDIYLFGRLKEHEPRIREVLASFDCYSCECERDVHLARSFGFKGRVLPVFPNSGGFDLLGVSELRQPGPVSKRRVIMLKGYQDWAGRALVGLRALERCSDLLKGCELMIFLANPAVRMAAELFEKSTGVKTRIIKDGTSHRDMLRMHGSARISIGLSISDAISTSLLEAMVMGSFPIQSWTACASEWIADGQTGILVPPEDPEIVEAAIRRALTDDTLVDQAAEQNYKVAEERLDWRELKAMAVDIYHQVAAEKVRKGRVSPC